MQKLFLVLLVYTVNSACDEKSLALDLKTFRVKRQISTNNYTCSDNLADFTCTHEGRFPDLSDSTCTWYFECVKNWNGMLINKYVQCPNYKFSPELETCSATYKCPCLTATTPQPTPAPGWWCKNVTLPNFNCEKVGRFPDYRDNTCMGYFLCSKFSNGTWIKTDYTCPNSGFDPATQKCNVNYTCPCSPPSTLPTTPPSTSITTPDYTCNVKITTYVSEFVCTEIGRYPDLGDTQCQKYFLCSKLRNETWIKTRYSCSGSTFDPLLNKCSIHYPCPCYTTTPQDVTNTEEVTTTSKAATTSTEVRTTNLEVTTSTEVRTTNPEVATSTHKTTTTTKEVQDCTSPAKPFECRTKGRFPDLTDFSCKSYFLCSQLSNGSILQTKYTCSGSAFFDPTASKCSVHYVCPCELTTQVGTTLATTLLPPRGCGSSDAADFQCSSNGRFPDLSDQQCSSYFLCAQYKNGTWVKKSYECVGSTFDPQLGKCSKSYSCPCGTTISTLTTSSNSCTPPSQPLPEFSCTNIGRYPDLGDSNCKTYFLCSLLRNGTWIKTRYSCKDSNFAPEIEKCDTSYPCPCLTYYTLPFYTAILS